MVKTEPEGDRKGKPSLKVKLSGKGATQKQSTDGSAKLKIRLPAAASDPAYSEPEAVDLAESDISDAEEIKPKKQPPKKAKKQAKKTKRVRTSDEADEVRQGSPYLLIQSMLVMRVSQLWPLERIITFGCCSLCACSVV